MTILHPGSPRNRSKYTRPFSPRAWGLGSGNETRFKGASNLKKFQYNHIMRLRVRTEAVCIDPVYKGQVLRVTITIPPFSTGTSCQQNSRIFKLQIDSFMTAHVNEIILPWSQLFQQCTNICNIINDVWCKEQLIKSCNLVGIYVVEDALLAPPTLQIE